LAKLMQRLDQPHDDADCRGRRQEQLDLALDRKDDGAQVQIGPDAEIGRFEGEREWNSEVYFAHGDGMR
jgi:hypothetical protein